MNKKNKNDFFNLETSSEEEEEAVEVNKEKIKKWDWDNPENFDLYYKYNNKRSLSSSSDQDSSKKPKINLNQNPNQVISIDKVIGSNHLYTLNGHQSLINRIYWGKKLLNTDLLLSSSFDTKIILWDLGLNQYNLYSNIHTKSIRNSIFSLHETEIVSISFDQTCVLTDIKSKLEKFKFTHTDLITSVANHPLNEHLILIGSKNQILTLDTRDFSNKPIKLYKPKSSMGLVQDILFINEKEFISCGDVVSRDSAEYSIMVWDFDSQASISNQIFHEKFICTCLKKHPFSSLFYAQTHGNYIVEFSTRFPYKMNKFKKFESNGHTTEGYSIGFDLNSSGSLLASASTDGSVYIYNTSSAKLIKKMNCFNDQLLSKSCLDVKFKQTSSNLDTIATCSMNGLIKIYKI